MNLNDGSVVQRCGGTDASSVWSTSLKAEAIKEVLMCRGVCVTKHLDEHVQGCTALVHIFRVAVPILSIQDGLPHFLLGDSGLGHALPTIPQPPLPAPQTVRVANLHTLSLLTGATSASILILLSVATSVHWLLRPHSLFTDLAVHGHMPLGATGVTDGVVGDVGLVLALPGLVAHTATVTTLQALRYLLNTQFNSALHWLNTRKDRLHIVTWIKVGLNKTYIEGKPGLLFQAPFNFPRFN